MVTAGRHDDLSVHLWPGNILLESYILPLFPSPGMADELLADEALLQRLPLPVAQLYRRALNAKNPLARHLAGYYVWEAGLKLLASVAIVEFARQGDCDAALQERVKNLARPSLGHWWEFARLLLPRLAEPGVEAFGQLRELVLGKPRTDLPRAAGLDALLRQTLDGKEGQRSRVQVGELFDRLVRYRNQVQAHGAPGQLEEVMHQRLGRALLAGSAELWSRIDVLAGRRLVHIGEVRQVAGAWLVERFELCGETARRVESLHFSFEAGSRLPITGRLYLETAGAEPGTYPHATLHPLVLFDAESEEVIFLNARRSRQRTEYLCYTSGRTGERPDLGPEQRDLLARVLGMPVAEEQAEQWTANSRAEEPAPEPSPAFEQRALGEFELVSALGRGGMGIVYRAWQPSLGRQVALKKLQKTGDAKAEARFAREINALGRVEHPNLVKIFTSGSEGDQWFYAMELIEGVPLSAVCERLQAHGTSVSDVKLETWHDAVTSCCAEARSAEKPLSESSFSRDAEGSGVERVPLPDKDRNYVRHIVTLMAQVAEAAHALHEAGILHRDIKPGNIMVTPDGTQAVLMDLGLAQLADDIEGRLTRTRQFVGTLRYAGPQQVLAVSRLDRRADVYSLGASLWELLALRPLFGATEQTPTPELMEKIQREEPERLRAIHPALPRDLEAIVHKCLEKDPHRRYATAHELARDLNRFLEGRPVQARRVSGLERAWKWVKRHPATAAVYGLMLLVTVLGLGGGSVAWLWLDAEAARQEAKSALEGEQKARAREALAKQAERKAETERGVSVALARAEQFAEQARKLPSISSAEGAAVLVVWRQADDALGQAEVALSTETADNALRQRIAALRAQLQGGRQQTERGRARALRKEKLFRDLDEARMARSVMVDNLLDFAGAAVKYSAAFAAYGLDVAAGPTDELARRIAGAEPEVREALLVALDDWAVAAALVPTAWSAKDLQALAQAADNDPWRKAYRAAVAAGDGKALRELSAEARRLPLPASTLEFLALTLYTRGEHDEAVAVLRMGRNHHPSDFWMHYDLGGFLLPRPGNGGRPLEVEEAIGSYRAALALRPAASVVHNNLGLALYYKKQLDEAIAEFNKAIGLDPKLAVAHNNLGNALRDKNQLDEAIAEFNKAIDLDPKLTLAHTNLGMALRDKNQLDDAIAEFNKAINLDPKDASAHHMLGMTLYHKKQVDEAIAELKKAIELDPKLAVAHNSLGKALHHKKQLDEAIAEFKKAVDLDPKYALAHNNLGIAFYHKKQLDEAIAEFTKATDLDPKHALAHNNLGMALRDKQQLDKAIAELKKAIDLDPKDALAYNNLGLALYDKKQVDGAIAEFKKAIDLNPNDAWVHNNLGIALRDKQQLDAAVTEFNKAIDLDPKHALAHCNLAVALRRQGQFAKALEAIQKGHLLGSAEPGWKMPSAQWITRLQSLLDLSQKEPGEPVSTESARNGIRGKLAKGDLLDWFPLTSRNFRKSYPIQLKGGQPYQIDLTGEFDVFLRIENLNYVTLALNNDVTPPGNLDARLVFTPEKDGVYRLVVTSFKAEDKGKYTLTVKEVTAAGPGETLRSELKNTDIAVQGRFVKLHKVDLVAGRPYVFELASPWFQSYLLLADPASKQTLVENGQAGDFVTASRIDFTPKESGSYQLMVTSSNAGETGPYMLRIQGYEQVTPKKEKDTRRGNPRP
jgi:tetratricopeptide (TPR) repeat protein/serine/threonine protein kinase